MRRFTIPAFVLLGVAVLQANVAAWFQGTYRPAVPRATSVNAYGGYGGYGGYYGGGTPAGSYLNGMANVISAQGNYNLSTSAAAVNMTQARRNDIENKQLWTNTYFEMRETNRAARKAEQAPPLTAEQLARIAQYGVPKQLAADQANAVSGKINWPVMLQDDRYAVGRTVLEEMFAKQAQYGTLPAADQDKARETAEAMLTQMTNQIRDVPPQQFTTAKSFLQSLNYSFTQTRLN